MQRNANHFKLIHAAKNEQLVSMLTHIVHAMLLTIILLSIVISNSDLTISFNIVVDYKQCGKQNIV